MAYTFNKRKLKLLILVIARSLRLFPAARYLTRNRLRILAYHGAALGDEAEFRGGLFMTAEKFESRIDFLYRKRYPILDLSEALLRLESGTLPSSSTVLTIDDGWLGTRTIMAPALRQRGFPATLYLSSYYMNTQTPVFNVATEYVLWKSQAPEVDLSDLECGLQGIYPLIDLNDRTRATAILWKYAETLDGAGARQELLIKLCMAVGIEPESITKERLLTYMNPEEAAELASFGIDVQLHTHRHRFSKTTFEEARREIEDNRHALRVCTPSSLKHFCYPSGEYEKQQLTWLQKLGIESATTTLARFNARGCNPLELGRFLDAEQISEIEFEAEMSGFYELLRWIGLR